MQRQQPQPTLKEDQPGDPIEQYHTLAVDIQEPPYWTLQERFDVLKTVEKTFKGKDKLSQEPAEEKAHIKDFRTLDPVVEPEEDFKSVCPIADVLPI